MNYFSIGQLPFKINGLFKTEQNYVCLTSCVNKTVIHSEMLL